MPRDVVVLFSQDEGLRLIRRHCRSIALPIDDLRALVEAVIEHDSMGRRHGLRQAFDDVLDVADAEATGAS